MKRLLLSTISSLCPLIWKRAGSAQSRETKWLQIIKEEIQKLLAHVLDVIAGDILLSRRLIQEAGIEGIYFSTQKQIQDEVDRWRIPKVHIEPSKQGPRSSYNEAGGITSYLWFLKGPARRALQGSSLATTMNGLSLAVSTFRAIVLLWVVSQCKKGSVSNKGNEQLLSKKRSASREAVVWFLIDCTVPQISTGTLDWVRQAAVL